ncbi:hypothetical protein BGCPKDLD_2844 [Methylorubrum suomiense]|uniref:Uncharacterized protein n=1 Tax=Methylorubrum suomiense TaxID=144191 RepID=A0ABQ4V006_9HYPH|nr:hypothetical protein BGCPKDLD_2844 [Methylorubrum suomiense]
MPGGRGCTDCVRQEFMEHSLMSSPARTARADADRYETWTPRYGPEDAR